MSRSPEVQRRYEERLKEIKESGLTPEQYLTDTLPWLNGVAYVKNEFPYEGDFEHYVLWFKDKSEGEIERLVSLIKRHTLVTIKRNETKDQSVKGLVHYHVFK